MKQEIKRWHFDFETEGCGSPCLNGEYVLYTDYQAKVEALEEIINFMNINCISVSLHDSRMKALEAEKELILKTTEGQRKINDDAWDKNKKLQAKLDKAMIALRAINSAYPQVGDHLTYPELAGLTMDELTKEQT